MESLSQLNRRKACDLCFTKKIKCDMLKPICSNCQLYKTECKTTAVRRRAAPQRARPQPQVPVAAQVGAVGAPVDERRDGQPSRVDGLESRLSRIEEQLQQVLAVASAAMNPAAAAAAANPPATAAAHNQPQTSTPASAQTTGAPAGAVSSLIDITVPNLSSMDDILLETNGLDLLGDSTEEDKPIQWVEEDSWSQHHLPPLDEVLPIVDDYFVHVNVFIPIFSQPMFMRMLQEWYNTPSKRSRAGWAAVNVVLAMGTRLTPMPVRDVDFAAPDPRLAGYLRNAQSVLSELVSRDEDLLGLQVVLALVLLFQGTKDPRPATVLIGTAVRLAHRLCLQSRDVNSSFPPEQVLLRNRLFWITYMWDKDISMRHQMPAVQSDGDIDLELPSGNPIDGAGDMFTTDGQVRLNFFRCRVQLAHLQGRIYDLLYSTRSLKISSQERRSRVGRLEMQLEDWRLSLPPEFQLDQVLDNLGRVPMLYMTQIHSVYMACLVLIHGIWSHNAEWIKRVSSYSRVAIGNSALSNGRCCAIQQPPLPRGWKRCVQASRSCLTMIAKLPQSDCSLWLNGCAYFSGLIILLAHMYEFPEHEHVESDKEIASYVMVLFDKITDVSALVPMQQLHIVVSELDRRARGAVDVARKKRLAGHRYQTNVRGDPLSSGPSTSATGDSYDGMTGQGSIESENESFNPHAVDMDSFPWSGKEAHDLMSARFGSPFQDVWSSAVDLGEQEASPGPFGDWLDTRMDHVFRYTMTGESIAAEVGGRSLG